MQLFIAQVLPRHAIHRTQYIGAGREVFIVYSVTLSRGKFSDASALLHGTRQEAQLMLTTGLTRLAVSRGQQTWYHSTC